MPSRHNGDDNTVDGFKKKKKERKKERKPKSKWSTQTSVFSKNIPRVE